MRMLMPSHAKNVKLYQDSQPVFTRYGIESQLDAMFTPTVQLRSGGYIVINQTEALVAIDVNSGRATREHHIEDTATKTNCEAAEEVARQLRLRDLAGLIVIDFIDMDEHRNNRTVERRLKEALKNDRARIQVGRISHFGLMEMSRQRIRSSVLESSTDKCPHCGGTGHVRSVSSVTLHMLRMIEEMLLKGATHNIVVRTRSEVALYVLNHKRAHLRDLESRFQITITVNADASVGAAQPFLIEKGELVHSVEAAKAIVAQQQQPRPPPAHEEDELDESVEDEVEESEDEGETETLSERETESDEDAAEGETAEGSAEPAEARGENGQRRGRRRRRGRGGRGGREREPREGAVAAKARRSMQRSSAHRMTATTRAKAMAPLRKVKRRKKDSRTDRTPVPDSRAASATAMDAAGGADAVADAATGAAARASPDMPARTAGKRAGKTAARRPARRLRASSTASSRKSRTPSPILAGRRARKRRSRPPCIRRSRSSRSRAPRRPCRPTESAAPHSAEPPKRRSTVREPAPMFSSGAMSDVQPAPATRSAACRRPHPSLLRGARTGRAGRRTQSPAASAGGRSADSAPFSMKSAWADRDAEAAVARYADAPRDVALRVYTTRLLGADPKLVLHGGGNTSVKTRVADLNGDAIEVLCVKGSGWDMATIEPPGLPAVRLDALRKLRARDALSDEDMVRAATREPDRSRRAEPVGRDAAARLPAAQVRRSHAFDRGAEPDRPAGRRRAVRGGLRRAHGLRALHHAGLRAREGRGGSLRARHQRRRADPAPARHLHLRRRRARSL